MTVHNVSTNTELADALKIAVGGDEVVLATGSYALLRVDTRIGSPDVQYATPLIIKAATPASPPTISEMWISEASNVTIDGLKFKYTYKSGDPEWTRKFQVVTCADIIIKNCEMVGDLADGKDYSIGLFVRGTSNITIENNEIRNFMVGADFARTNGLNLLSNDMHSFSRDATNFAEVQNVLIQDNHFHDFNGVGDGSHRDMVQFLTQSTNNPSINITIKNNLFDIGNGSWTQSIFIRNEEVDMGRAGLEMYYQNILIEGNIIYNYHTHGITVGETDGLTIRYNSVIYAEGDPLDIDNQSISGGLTLPEIRPKASSKNVTIMNNVTTDIVGYSTQPDWTVSANVVIQPENYTDEFTIYATGPVDGYTEFRVKPGGSVDLTPAGSPLMVGASTPALPVMPADGQVTLAFTVG